MAALKWLLAILGLVLFGSAGALVVYDVYVASQLRRLLKRKSERRAGATTSLPARPLPPVRWQRVAQLALLALLPLLAAASMVERDGNDGARVGQIREAQPRGWYPGVHGMDGNGEVTRLVRA
jgi:hypothetical protein